MATSEQRWLVSCTTEGKDIPSGWQDEAVPAPTTCPNDANHTITTVRTLGKPRQESAARLVTDDDGKLVTDDDGEYLVMWEE